MTDVSKLTPFHDIYKTIRTDLNAVENLLKEIGGSSNPLIAEVNKYLFQKEGKRIRPALLILCSKLGGYRGTDHVFWSALVEIIHTASLIHDDIVDNSFLRRGRDTVHAKWGPNITVLLGDFLYIQSIALALRTKNHAIIDILADVTVRMIEGELIEYSITGKPELSEDLYLEILDKKTAQLFSASCRIGGVLAGSLPEEEQRLYEFGRNLGLSFQIIDDLLDFTGDEATLGKPILSDFREGRITLPLIHALRRTKGQARVKLLHLIHNRKTEKNAGKKILAHIVSHGALDYAYQRAAAFSQKAKDILAAFPKSPHRESLNRMADMVLQRRK
jgi:octaprenyl-diphosphate synthase